MTKQTKQDIKEDMEMIQTIAFHNGVEQGIQSERKRVSEIIEKWLIEKGILNLKAPFFGLQISSNDYHYLIAEINKEKIK